MAAALDAPCALKLEAPGEDAATLHAQIQRGARCAGKPPQPPLAHGELAHGRLTYLGLEDALTKLAAFLAERPWVRCLNPPADILNQCDKLACRVRLDGAGIPQPPLLGEIDGFAALEAAMQAHDCARVFVKPRYGSSAAGVVALSRNPQGRFIAETSTEIVRGTNGLRLFNALRVRRYRDREVAELINALSPQRLYAERWIPKPVRAGRGFDVRIVTLAGEPQHRVARSAPHPITNLHLGAARGTLEAWVDTSSVGAVEAAARRVAACFPHSAIAGIDLIVRRTRVHVLEVNAFGDWLPRLRWRGQLLHDTQAAWLRQNFHEPTK